MPRVAGSPVVEALDREPKGSRSSRTQPYFKNCEDGLTLCLLEGTLSCQFLGNREELLN